MIDLDFVEIGTSDFNTLIQKCNDDASGISIEPIKVYLDRLPNKKFVKKINCAISFNDTESITEIYYISEENIKKYNLSEKLKGCNSIGKYHPQHVEKQLQHLVSIDKIQQIPLSAILINNNIRGISFLKIDTEGSDAEIMLHFYEYIVNRPKQSWPKRILFESNQLNPQHLVNLVKEKFVALGYQATNTATDTVLDLKP